MGEIRIYFVEHISTHEIHLQKWMYSLNRDKILLTHTMSDWHISSNCINNEPLCLHTIEELHLTYLFFIPPFVNPTEMGQSNEVLLVYCNYSCIIITFIWKSTGSHLYKSGCLFTNTCVITIQDLFHRSKIEAIDYDAYMRYFFIGIM